MAGLLGSLYNGNTGLRAASTGISVTGDNIANTSTVGHKGSRAHFADLMSEMIVGLRGGDQLGRGVRVSRIEKIFSQGAFQQTGVPTDMAISGDGFFILKSPGAAENHYSRAGQFRFDDEGFLVSPIGSRVQGYAAQNGALSGTLSDIQLDQGNLPPQATSQLDMISNLDPDTSPFQTTVQVYDSQGNTHDLDLTLTLAAGNTWDLSVLPEGGVAQNLGQLQFDADGQLLVEPAGVAVIDWGNGAAQSQISFDFGEIGGEASSQWNSGESEIRVLRQDGFGTGALDSVSVGDDGIVTGAYTNGETRSLGQVALARFEDPTGLLAVGGTEFAQSPQSGEALVGTANAGGRGAIVGAALELSNVELSDEFIQLIAYQRSFQANSRTIQTADGLIQEVFQLLR